jgi:hypothetical protein
VSSDNMEPGAIRTHTGGMSPGEAELANAKQ